MLLPSYLVDLGICEASSQFSRVKIVTTRSEDRLRNRSNEMKRRNLEEEKRTVGTDRKARDWFSSQQGKIKKRKEKKRNNYRSGGKTLVW